MQGCRGFRGRTGVNSLSESGERSRQTLWRRSSRPALSASTSSTSHAGEPARGASASMSPSLRAGHARF